MANGKKKAIAAENEAPFVPAQVPESVIAKLSLVADEPGVGGPYEPPADEKGCVAYTHFDSPGAENNLITILLDKRGVERLPMQSLVRIVNRADEHTRSRKYLGVVVAGPFAEPDGLRADAALVVSTTVAGHGRVFLPRYHARAQVQILGEEIAPAQLVPARYRPVPNSAVFALNDDETQAVYKAGGSAKLGTVIGHPTIDVGIDPSRKSVLPRHTGVLGTTGGGKSTTIARFVQQLTESGVSVVLFDVEGEYTEIDKPTDDPVMLAGLADRQQSPQGVGDLRVHHLVGRDTSRSVSPELATPFRLDFGDLSPFAVMEILELSDPQQERFLKAYDTLRLLMRELEIFPRRHNDEEQRRAMELDENETGVPRMTLRMLIDVVNRFHDYAAMPAPSSRTSGKGEDRSPASSPPATYPIISSELKGHENELWTHVLRAQAPRDVRSWRGLLGKLLRVARLRVFDSNHAQAIDTAELLRPGRASVIDLSDTDAPAVNNLVIATLLRQIQEQQERNFRHAEQTGHKPTPTVVIIEEAHEFLSSLRIKQMPVLFQQVAKIAKRGRKRWLGLCFVTQLPQHLPDEVLGLINNWVIHKISDGGVIDRLRKSIAGLDKAQWGMVPALAPGQAVVSLTSMTRPLLTAIDPTPCRLRLVE